MVNTYGVVTTQTNWIWCPVCGERTMHHAKGLCRKCYQKYKRLSESKDMKEELFNVFRERGYKLMSVEVVPTEGGFTVMSKIVKWKHI